jgi:hypothetical protein
MTDRATELARLRRCLGEVLGGGARLAMIEGPTGIGKTSLLHQVRDEARAAGATVLSARGSRLEKEFGFRAVRQLFEPVLAGDSGDALLAGASIGGSRMFHATAAPGDAPGDAPESLFTILHGLYWLTSNLSTRAPLALAVDDVQWCDTGTQHAAVGAVSASVARRR